MCTWNTEKYIKLFKSFVCLCIKGSKIKEIPSEIYKKGGIKMGLPYEKQILKLLQELSHYQIVMRHCRQEKAKYTDEIEKTCSEIELAVHKMQEKQQEALSQWRKINEQERWTIIFSITEGIEKMTELARQKGCSAMGYYLEFIIMEEILELLDQPEVKRNF